MREKKKGVREEGGGAWKRQKEMRKNKTERRSKRKEGRERERKGKRKRGG